MYVCGVCLCTFNNNIIRLIQYIHIHSMFTINSYCLFYGFERKINRFLHTKPDAMLMCGCYYWCVVACHIMYLFFVFMIFNQYWTRKSSQYSSYSCLYIYRKMENSSMISVIVVCIAFIFCFLFFGFNCYLFLLRICNLKMVIVAEQATCNLIIFYTFSCHFC